MSGWTNQQPTTLTVGTIPGEHIVIINPDTGDALDVYDASNRLILAIDAQGIIHEYLYIGAATTPVIDNQFQDEAILLKSLTDNSLGAISFVRSTGVNTQAEMQLTVGPNALAGQEYQLSLLAESDDASLAATATGTERGVTGSLMQSDEIATNSLLHMGSYSCNTNASGIGTFNHGCSFGGRAPAGGVLVANAAVAATATQFSIQTGSWTSTQVTIAVKTTTGAAYNGTATFYGIFWG